MGIGDEVSLGGKLVELKAVSEGVRGFGANYIFSNISSAREIGNFPQNKVSAFLVNVKKGYTTEEIAQVYVNDTKLQVANNIKGAYFQAIYQYQSLVQPKLYWSKAKFACFWRV